MLNLPADSNTFWGRLLYVVFTPREKSKCRGMLDRVFGRRRFPVSIYYCSRWAMPDTGLSILLRAHRLAEAQLDLVLGCPIHPTYGGRGSYRVRRLLAVAECIHSQQERVPRPLF